ncbi:MAG: NADH:ubiquinone reductase (Na(+)-transporting) subunit F [Granulosicoccus sp.]|nr:NADH:ubiquinone reductase (Na(+)-transporting) subunit F [Granulosicoccus sp.]
MSTIVYSLLLFVAFATLLALFILLARRWLVPDRPIAIRLNSDRQITGHFGQKLLQALNECDIHLPSACAGAGTCGLCHVHLTHTAPPPTPIDKALLNPDQIRSGERLACQLSLRTDIEITLADEVLSTSSWQARVVCNRSLSPLIHEIELAADTQPFQFESGDFMQLTAPAGTTLLKDVDPGDTHRAAWQSLNISQLGVRSEHPQTRAYSLANRPEDTQSVILMIRLALPPAPGVAPGVVSSYLCTRRPGDRVELSGPHRGFRIVDESRELVFVGGGVGMAPLRSMIHRQTARQHALPMNFYYGARTQADLLYREEFDSLSAAENGFSWTPALSEPDPSWSGEQGFIHTVLRKQFLDAHPVPASCDYYLCGPPLMIRAVVDELHAAGVQDTHIYKDEFG